MKNLTFILIFILTCTSFNFPFKNYTQKIKGTSKIIELIAIPGGEFKMGSPENENGRKADEGPQKNIKISPFWMSNYEITWDLYHLFMERKIDKIVLSKDYGNEVSIKIDAISGATTPYIDMSFGMGTEGYPAINMTHYAASKFCQWLSAITGNYYRLPTEAEWEYACRAGSESLYSFGQDTAILKDYAWFKENSNRSYKKVGLKKPNKWGVYDMHGNVSEWTLDQYTADAYQKRNNTKNPYMVAKNTYPRTIRGGSWKDEAMQLRSAKRHQSSPKFKKRDPQIPKSKWWNTDAPFIGFRIVRPLETPSIDDQNLLWEEKKID